MSVFFQDWTRNYSIRRIRWGSKIMATGWGWVGSNLLDPKVTLFQVEWEHHNEPLTSSARVRLLTQTESKRGTKGKKILYDSVFCFQGIVSTMLRQIFSYVTPFVDRQHHRETFITLKQCPLVRTCVKSNRELLLIASVQISL